MNPKLCSTCGQPHYIVCWPCAAKRNASGTAALRGYSSRWCACELCEGKGHWFEGADGQRVKTAAEAVRMVSTCPACNGLGRVSPVQDDRDDFADEYARDAEEAAE